MSASGAVFLDAWGPSVERAARSWGRRPFGGITTDHVKIGRFEGRPVRTLVPGGGCPKTRGGA